MLGIDGNREAFEQGRRNARDYPPLEFRQHSLDAKIPLDDATVDIAYSHNLIECLSNVSLLVSELARVLRPGGLVIMAHWDWDSQLFNGGDKNLNRRLVHAFCDWQQDWMDHADGWMGRRLWSTFNSTGLFGGVIHARVLVNTDFSPGQHHGICLCRPPSEASKRLISTGQSYRSAPQELTHAERNYMKALSALILAHARPIKADASPTPSSRSCRYHPRMRSLDDQYSKMAFGTPIP